MCRFAVQLEDKLPNVAMAVLGLYFGGSMANRRPLLVRSLTGRFVRGAAMLKQPVLFAEGAHRTDVRNRESDPEERLVTNSGINPAELNADAAAIGVVSDL